MKKLSTYLAIVIGSLVLAANPAVAQRAQQDWSDATTALSMTSTTATGAQTAVDTAHASAVLFHVTGVASTSSITLEQSIDNSHWYTSATITNATAAGELWACPPARYARFDVVTHSAGALYGYIATREWAADPLGTSCKKIDVSPAVGTLPGTAITGTATVDSLTSAGTVTGGSIVASDITPTYVPYAGASGLLIGASSFKYTTSGGILDVTAIRPGGLTATYVPFAGTNGLLGNYSGFTYVGATTSGLLTAPHMKDNSLTATYVPFASATGFDSYAGFTYAGTTTAAVLTAPHVRDNSLTNTRVPYAQTTGGFLDAATFTFNGTTLGVPQLTDAGLTITRIPYASTNGLLIDAAGFAYVTSTGAMAVTAGTAPSVSTNRFLSTGTAPAVANVGSNSCGTDAATIVGKDQVSIVTVGATSGTECRVTFNVAFANAPGCTATGQTATDLHGVSTTTYYDFVGTLTAGEKITVICLGW